MNTQKNTPDKNERNELDISKTCNEGGGNRIKFLSALTLISMISMIFLILAYGIPIDKNIGVNLGDDQIIVTDIDGNTKIVNISYINETENLINDVTTSKKAKTHTKPAPPEKYYTINEDNKVIEGPAEYSIPDKKTVPEKYKKPINYGPVVVNITDNKKDKDNLKTTGDKINAIKINKNVTSGIKNNIDKISSSHALFVNVSDEDIENYKKNYKELERKADEKVKELEAGLEISNGGVLVPDSIRRNNAITPKNKTKLGKLDHNLVEQIKLKQKYMLLKDNKKDISIEKKKNSTISALKMLGSNINEPSTQKVILYVDHKLTEREIKELEEFGANINKNSWIPPIGTHPYGFYTGSIPADLNNLYNILRIEMVKRISSGEGKIKKNLDVSIPLINASTLWDAVNKLGAPENYDGTGIKIAIIDTGFDTTHPDFQDRVIDTWNYISGSDEVTSDLHGTQMASIALGNDSNHRGVAPDAQLIALQVSDSDWSDVLNAINDAANPTKFGADIILLPISSSSIDTAPHRDGTDYISQAINSAVGNGVIVIASAGNNGNAGLHVSGELEPGEETQFTFNYAGNSEDSSLLLYLVWNNQVVDLDISQIVVGNNADVICVPMSEDIIFCDPDTTFASYNGGDTEDTKGILHDKMVVELGQITDIVRIRVKNNHPSLTQSFDLYQESESSGAFEDPDPFKTIDGTSTAEGSIVVGSYISRENPDDPKSYEGYVSINSARGPTLDGRIKPDVVAPGEVIYSINVGGGYIKGIGTSGAAAHVGGAAALLLDINPSLTPDEAKEVLKGSAVNVYKYATSDYYDNVQGSGLINLVGAYLPALSVKASDIEFDSPLEGDPVTVDVMVHNSGLKDANNFKVNFLVSGITPSSPIIYSDSKIISLSAHSTKTIQFTWPEATSGTHRINVTIDSENIIDEFDETNNQAEKLIVTITPSVDLYLGDPSYDHQPLMVDDPNGISTPVYLVDDSSLEITKYADKNQVSWFDVVEYTIVIANPSSETASLKNLTDIIPPRMKYINNTAVINGKFQNHPEVVGNKDVGTNLTWRFDCRNILPGSLLKITYKVMIYPCGGCSRINTVHLNYYSQNITTTVNFYKDELSEDNLISSDTVIMPCKGGTATAHIGWTPETTNINEIKVLVDPDNSIIESNEENNDPPLSCSIIQKGAHETDETNNEETIQEFVNHQLNQYSSAEGGNDYEYCTDSVLISKDDGSKAYTLPFTFPIYDSHYSTVYAGTNGYITFDGGSNRCRQVSDFFKNAKMIAAEGGDLVTTIYVCNHEDYVTFRWVGHHYGNSDSVDVEVRLYENGNIKINQNNIGATSGYGTENVVGVSRGDNSYYTQPSSGNGKAYIFALPWGDYSWSDTGHTYDSCSTYLLNGDDTSGPYNLPFNFPLYDYNYNKVYLGTNGYITFGSGIYQWWNIGDLLKNKKMIAVEGGDLVTTIYACNYGDHVTFRWVGRHFGRYDNIDVEAILFSDGDIKINQNSIGDTSGYGTENVLGVSRGDNSHYARLTPGNSQSYVLFPPPPESV